MDYIDASGYESFFMEKFSEKSMTKIFIRKKFYGTQIFIYLEKSLKRGY